MQNQDRRKTPRASGLCQKNLIIADLDSEKRSAARIVDLSENGACIEHDTLIIGREITLSFMLPNSSGKKQRCEALAKVLRRQGSRVSLALKPLRPINMLQLRDFVWRCQN